MKRIGLLLVVAVLYVGCKKEDQKQCWECIEQISVFRYDGNPSVGTWGKQIGEAEHTYMLTEVCDMTKNELKEFDKTNKTESVNRQFGVVRTTNQTYCEPTSVEQLRNRVTNNNNNNPITPDLNQYKKDILGYWEIIGEIPTNINALWWIIYFTNDKQISYSYRYYDPNVWWEDIRDYEMFMRGNSVILKTEIEQEVTFTSKNSLDLFIRNINSKSSYKRISWTTPPRKDIERYKSVILGCWEEKTNSQPIVRNLHFYLPDGIRKHYSYYQSQFSLVTTYNYKLEQNGSFVFLRINENSYAGGSMDVFTNDSISIGEKIFIRRSFTMPN